MSYNQNKSKLKSYHLILFGSLLGLLLVLNSNRVNESKFKINQNKKEKALFDKIISKRRLQAYPLRKMEDNEENEEELTKTEKVCSHTSDDLKEYYNTGDLSKIDLDDGAIKCEDKDEDYMKALIDLVTTLIEGKDEEEDDDTNDNTLGNLRNLIDSETEENIKTYGKRVLPLLVFAIMSIFCIFGWIVCCFCTCCDCCCCCCCKKIGCKIPCFIFTYAFYALVLAVCLYGITQTNKIFTGLYNTECSFLKFFDEILKGEQNDKPTKWIGIEGVSNILDKLYEEINDMSEADLKGELENLMEEIDEKREDFLPKLKTVHRKFYKDEDDTKEPKEGYYIEYKESDGYFIEANGAQPKLNGKYVLDLVEIFGKYDVEKNNFTGINYAWNLEISEIDKGAKKALDEASESFENILGDNLPKIKEGLNTGKEKLNGLRKPFDKAYNKLTKVIYDVSEYTNKYGQLAVQLVFGLLGAMNLILAVLLLLICLCSGKSCVDFCCCRCLCKLFTHIIWNILALLMVITFLIGSILSLVGRVGGDMMSLVSFIMSEDNFNAENPILLDELGEGKDILKECINGEGNLSSVFELDGLTGDFDIIYQVKDEITEYKKNFTDKKEYFAYNYIKSYLINRIEFITDTGFINLDSEANIPYFKLFDIMKLLNDSIGSTYNEKWNPYTGDKNFICNSVEESSGTPNDNLLHPWFCEPLYRGWVDVLSSTNKIKNYATITNDAIKILKYASNNAINSFQDYESYYDILDELKYSYSEYLDTFVDVLGFFETITGNIINALQEGIGGSNDTFSFLNGKFIKNDLKILLKYLKYSLGKDIYTVGVCIIIVGLSLIFSISSTILLIVIINVDLERNKKLAIDNEIPEYQETNEGRVIQFKFN